MPLIKYINHKGGIFEAEVASGTSVMQGAVDNMIDGIVGECGGSCSCATCHVYIADGWMDKLTPPDPMEKDMLECVLEPRESSRLSCQVVVTDALDGLEVEMPATQY
jgi:2Fe-2S ferredoxin